MSVFISPIIVILVALLTIFSIPNTALADGPDCAADSRITESFDNGAVWDFCWESRIRENLILRDVYYTPPSGEPLRVLSSARLSQLHVAYDDSDVTYNDVTQYGLGGGYLLTLTEADCPNGVLLAVQTRPALCQWRTQADTGFRTASRANKTDSLNLFSVSQVGAYAYIISWTFHADGAIEPGLGATGALQRSSDKTELPFGRTLSGDPDTQWLSHTHSYYWRLDFDLGVNATDDVVSEIRYETDNKGHRTQTIDRFTAETARRVNREQQATWLIGENDEPDAKAYTIEPIRSGHRFERIDIEPYTDFDFFVTVANDCERFASQNARFNPDCLNDVLQFVDGQPTENQDLIVWYRVSFHHVPRNEDQRHMHTHWDGFVIEPRNILPGTNIISTLTNTPPNLPLLPSRSSAIGETIHEHIAASDMDGDWVALSANGLPAGLSMNSAGHVRGIISSAGAYSTTITARDDVSETTQTFVWNVTSEQSQQSGRGALEPVSLLILLMLFLYSRSVENRHRSFAIIRRSQQFCH